MAAIQPNSDIWLLSDVPLDNTYQHTIYFANPSDQQVTFAAKTKRLLNDQSYQRVHRNKLRVQCLADDIYDCNYLMFRNTSFGNKWFYCFVTEVEYVNNVVSEITYEIDVMQTWMFDYELMPCFVEREHQASDIAGDNIIPEPIQVGEYEYNTYHALTASELAVILSVVDTQSTVEGHLYDGIYGGTTLWAFKSTDVTGINTKIGEYLAQPDAITNLYMCPIYILPQTPPDDGMLLEDFTITGDQVVSDTEGMKGNGTLCGYTPKNQKLFTYPFNFYHVDNSRGHSLSLRYEFFDNKTPQYIINGNVTQPVQIKFTPYNYKRTQTMQTETLVLDGFPMCSWNTDAYEAWVAQNAIPVGIDTVAWGAASIAGIALNPLRAGGVITSGIEKIGNLLSEQYKASIAADITKGSENSGSVNAAKGNLRFFAGRVSINAQSARCIDDYFSMFGYACKRLKVPNTHTRPHWTYTKTVDCVITGSVPTEDANKICKIYDAGITFWRYLSEVGNYNLDNTPDIFG